MGAPGQAFEAIVTSATSLDRLGRAQVSGWVVDVKRMALAEHGDHKPRQGATFRVDKALLETRRPMPEHKARGAAARVGVALLEVKRQMPAEDWDRWQRENLALSPEVTEAYMRLAREY